LFVVCGKANFINMSRYSNYSDRTYRRQYDKPFDFTAFNALTIAEAVPQSREQIAAIDASFVDKSGKHTWGLGWFYNGSAGKAAQGLEISVIAVVDVSAHQGYTLAVQQTIPSEQAKKSKKAKADNPSEQVQGYIRQLQTARPYLPKSVRYLAADGFYSKKSFVDSVCALELDLVGKLRIDANLRYIYTGTQQPRGAHRKYDGKVFIGALSRLKLVCQVEEEVSLYTQVVWHVSLKRQIRLAYLINTANSTMAMLFSTDINIDPQTIYLYYKARFQIEFVFRDAKQFTGLCDCQSRQPARLNFHFNASLSALNLAKLDMGKAPKIESTTVLPVSFSMNDYHRQAQNRYFMEVFISMLGLDQTLIQSHPNYEKCLRHGSLSF
jgi:hypothetical protein